MKKIFITLALIAVTFVVISQTQVNGPVQRPDGSRYITADSSLITIMRGSYLVVDSASIGNLTLTGTVTGGVLTPTKLEGDTIDALRIYYHCIP